MVVEKRKTREVKSMSPGRPTIDPKGEVMRVRINSETRNCLNKISSQTGENISEIIRKAVIQYISQF